MLTFVSGMFVLMCLFFSTAVVPLSEAMNSHDLLQGRLNTVILHLLA